MKSRRQFLSKSALAAAALASTRSPAENPDARGARADTETISLCGTWAFQIDPDDLGTKKSWHTPDYSTPQWRDVTVPHAWQIDPAHTEYRGIGWYRRSFEALLKWQDAAVHLQFEAVFHTATVWVNGQMAGEHARKGYTAFTLDITPMLRLGQSNLIAVRVDNAFNEHMLLHPLSAPMALRWLTDRFDRRPLRDHLIRTVWPTMFNPMTYVGMARLAKIAAKVITGRKVPHRPL